MICQRARLASWSRFTSALNGLIALNLLCFLPTATAAPGPWPGHPAKPSLERALRSGEPRDAWRASALYLQPIKNEPNFNGNLMQVSLLGTNPARVLSLVSDFQPQDNGAILAKRRLSRSGHELLYLPPGAIEKARVLTRAMDFGSTALSPDGEQWAAFLRPSVGASWVLAYGSLQADQDRSKSMELPGERSRPGRLSWQHGSLRAEIREGDQVVIWELVKRDGSLTWRKPLSPLFPPDAPLMLNKSETLQYVQMEINGKPATRVVREWFTGDRKTVATLAGFEGRQMEMTPDTRFALLSGMAGGRPAAYTVDIATGKAWLLRLPTTGAIRLYAAPPRARP